MAAFRAVLVDVNGAGAKMEETRREIAAAGGAFECRDSRTEDETIAAAAGAEIIITDAALISRRVMESLPKLRAVIRCGVGYDTVDVAAATDNGIWVVNVPDFCWEEVSNHVLMFILAYAKKLIPLNSLTKKGLWAEAKAAQAPMASVHGETLGIIGCGRIGRYVAAKAACFKMNVIGYDRYLPAETAKEAGIALVELDELLNRSDYVSLHTALTPETFHMMGDREFGLMKPGAVIINTARGPVIDEAALVRALRENRIAGACLDVFEKEPAGAQNPLLAMDQVIAMPHSASYSEAAFAYLRTSVGREAARIGTGGTPVNIVNRDVVPRF